MTIEQLVPGRFIRLGLAAFAAACLLSADEFQTEIRPVLAEYCGACHGPGSDHRVRLLDARSSGDIQDDRSLWLNVAMQLRNRTMPPAGPQPSEADRMRVAAWIDATLRATACEMGERAGPVVARRLNRTEYENTVRDLFGLQFEVAELFPVDGSGGEGFDNNGETLFFSPLLAERYLEVTDRILDRVVVTPPLGRAFVARDLLPGREPDDLDSVEMLPGDSVRRTVSFYEDGDYRISARIRSPAPEETPEADILVDGSVAATMRFRWSAAEATSSGATVSIGSGDHEVALALRGEGPSVRLVAFDIDHSRQDPGDAKVAAHFRLFGSEPGHAVIAPRAAASRLLRDFMARAYRRPLAAGEAEPFLALFDRALSRGEPYEAGVRVALKAVLVSPDFLYRTETPPSAPGAHPISNHELATRLSYFLWGSMPDPELRYLADSGRLADEDVLAGEVDRLLDHPRSRFFARAFIGQWLGTKDVGGRVAPTLNEIQHFYTPLIAADMREEPVLLFQRMLAEDRSLLEFVNADYTYLTERLARHYGMPDAVQGNEFQLVATPGGRRGGLLGFGAVQAMNAGYKRSSPVLRGVWTLETLLGTKIPAPPPDVPALETEKAMEGKRTARETLSEHRANPACAACHDIIDPIGFGLENYDWLGRWRDVDEDGSPVDASGVLPSGEAFDGPSELREVLLGRRENLLRHVARKLFGYALGRGLTDADDCVIETAVASIRASNYGTRSLVREIVLSKPFRYVEAEALDRAD